ncbi:MAG: hypothetical protein WC763_04675 [Candidatus Paceibacterota bacterium]|jgi:hypothetical protein
MVFAEKKIKGGGFEYELEDVFGKMLFKSERQLPPADLDALVMFILKTNKREGEVEGVRFEFTKNNDWQKDDENNDTDGGEDREAL